jgi:hypothetical protein
MGMSSISKSIMVIILVAFMMIGFPGCSQKSATEEYNITGKWSVSFNWGWESFARDVTFNGSKQSGSLTDVFGNSGSYTVNDKSVSWTYAEFSTTYTGNFSSTTAMSGTMKQTYEGQTYSGTWTAAKTASASVIENFLFNRNNVILSRLREIAGGNQESEPAPRTNLIKPPRDRQASSPAADDYFSVERFPKPAAMTGFPWNMTPIDFDSDGDLDVIFIESLTNPWGNGLILAYKNDGQGHFSDATSYVLNGATQTYALESIVADFNSDGRKDLFLAEGGIDANPWPGGQNLLFIQSGDGRLINETSSRLPTLLDFTHSAVGADIDGDGDVDIFCCNVYCQNQKWPHFLLNDGKGFFTRNIDRLPNFVTNDSSSNFKRFTGCLFADVDKDGDSDLILGGHPGIGDKSWIERDIVLINDGTGRFSYGTLACAPEAFTPLRTKWSANNIGTVDMRSADFNNDGWPDLVAATCDYVTDSKLQLLLNNQNGTFSDASSRIPHDFVGDVGGPHSIAVCDINQDGLMDLMEREARTCGIRIFMNRGNAVFTEIHDALGLPNITWMAAWPGDFDGDGDTDFIGIRTDFAYFFRNLRPYR